MSDEFSMPLASRKIHDYTITEIVATLCASGISIHRDRFFASGETDYYFRAHIGTEPIDCGAETGDGDDIHYDALFFMSRNENTIQVLSAVQMRLISFGKFISAGDETSIAAIKIPDEYLVRVPETEKDAVFCAKESLELLFTWLERKQWKTGNIFVTVSRSHFYDDIRIVDREKTYFDALQPWWFPKRFE